MPAGDRGPTAHERSRRLGDRDRRSGLPLSGRRHSRTVLAQPARRRRVDHLLFGRGAARGRGGSPASRAIPTTSRPRRFSTASTSSTRRSSPCRRARRRSWIRSIASSCEVCLGGARGRRLRARRQSDRRSACSPAPVAWSRSYLVANQGASGSAGRDRGAQPHHQRQGLPEHPGVLQAQPDGAERHRADRLLDLAGGGSPGLPEPADRWSATWRSPGRPPCGFPTSAATSRSRGASTPPTATAGPSTPAARHGLRQRRRCGGAQAAGGRAGRRRSDPRRDPGLGDQQRRRAEGQLHRAERRRASPSHGRGAGGGRRGARQHRLRRVPRHRHAARAIRSRSRR